MKKVIRKEKKKNRKNKLQKIKEQGGPSCKLFWSDLRGKKKNRRITRMRGKDGAVVEETEQILEVLAKHWEELGKSCNSLDPEQEPELPRDRMGGSGEGFEDTEEGEGARPRWNSK